MLRAALHRLPAARRRGPISVRTSSRARLVAAAALLTLGALNVGTIPALASAPANDDFSNARSVLPLPATIDANNANATTQPNEPESACVGMPANRSLWYRLQLPTDSTVI